jgi:hypothetical protein
VKLSKQLTTVTTFSKIVALIMFVSFPFIGFYLGISYQKRLDKPFMSIVNVKSQQQTTKSEHAACTMEAKLCPDGSYVGRTGPNCEFEKCPGQD